jgi:hypothetical protein
LANRDVQYTSDKEDDSEDNILHGPDARELNNGTDCDRGSDIGLQAHDDKYIGDNNGTGDRGAECSGTGNGIGCSSPFKPLEVGGNTDSSAQYSPLMPPMPAENPPASALLTSPNIPEQDPLQIPETTAAKATAGLPVIEEHQFPLDGPVMCIG